jgi:hypothetical protein
MSTETHPGRGDSPRAIWHRSQQIHRESRILVIRFDGLSHLVLVAPVRSLRIIRYSLWPFKFVEGRWESDNIPLRSYITAESDISRVLSPRTVPQDL